MREAHPASNPSCTFKKKEKENVIVPSYFKGDGLLTEENVYPLLEDDEFLVVEALKVELQHGGLAEDQGR